MHVNAGNVESLAQSKFDENHDFRQYLKWQHRMTDEALDRLVSQTARRVESQFDCATCGNCCKDLAPSVTQGEADRIASRLGLTPEEFHRQYLKDEPEPGELDEDGRPAEPRWQMRGRPCPLFRDNACIVRDDRPEQCRQYPYLHEPEFSHRTLGMIDRTFTCPIAFQVMEELKEALSFHRRGHRR